MLTDEPILVKGGKLAIRFCKGAKDTYVEALTHISKKEKQTTEAVLIAQMRHLSLYGKGSIRNKNRFRDEGKLPDKEYFWAFKHHGIRAYGWYSEKLGPSFIVSHFIFKPRDTQKLQPADTNLVHTNWHKLEKDGKL